MQQNTLCTWPPSPYTTRNTFQHLSIPHLASELSPSSRLPRIPSSDVVKVVHFAVSPIFTVKNASRSNLGSSGSSITGRGVSGHTVMRIGGYWIRGFARGEVRLLGSVGMEIATASGSGHGNDVPSQAEPHAAILQSQRHPPLTHPKPHHKQKKLTQKNNNQPFILRRQTLFCPLRLGFCY